VRDAAKVPWERVSPLLDELLDADAAARTARLEQIRRDDATLADRVEQLLAQRPAVERESFLEGLATDVPDASGIAATLAGTTVGAYELERPLGQGGMGSVWLARRSDGRYEGQVAVKFLNLALLARGGAERFRREGVVLAKLTHPNIARLIDAGVAAGGQPYLVLEYIDGEPIDVWCDTRALDVPSRIRLLLDVLSAVAHAHTNLVLHRDLKPNNILVTRDGQVKLLDFGIAKLLATQEETTPATQLTELAGRAFTPEFAAPEQIEGGDATTATDVYALGVLAYVLLTGQHPTAESTTTPIERMQAVVQTEPARLSVAVTRGVTAPASDLPQIAAKRASTPLKLARTLRGDLDNIVVKALKKSPAERYANATAFAEDLRRYLNHEPVMARPDSLTYRAGKFVQRYRLAVGAASIVLLAVLAASVISIWQAREATRQRDRALALSTRNEAVVDFVTTMLTEVAPTDRPVRVADLLDRSLSMLMSGESNPEHEAAILRVLANYFMSGAGDPAKAKALLDRSLELTRSSSDAALRGVLLCDSAYAATLLGRREDAAVAIEQGLALSSSDHLAATRCLHDRAGIARFSNDPEATRSFALQALARLRASSFAKPADEAVLLETIAAAHASSGRVAEADRYFAESLAKLAQSGRGESARTAVTRNNWGVASFSAGDYRRALQNYDEAVRIAAQHSPGGEAPPYLLSNRAKALRELGRYPEALRTFDLAIESATRIANPAMQIDALVNRAATYLVMEDLSRAEQSMAEAVAVAGTAMPPDSTPGVSLRLVQARIAAARGRLPEAASGLSGVVDLFARRKVSGGPVANVLRARADVYLLQGNVDAALADAQRALEISRALQGDSTHSTLTGLALAVLARTHERRGASAEARAAAAEAVPHLSATLGDEHPETLRVRQAATLVTRN
jgi:eukaryotic-like serine/threonine-protein kinase